MNRLILLVFLLLFFCGCTADHYVRQADRDVRALVGDREKKALDYNPQVDVPLPIVSSVPARAYQKIPTSPIPPTGAPAIEIERVVLPREPLGPNLRTLEGAPIEGGDWAAELTAQYQPREALGPPALARVIPQFDLFASLAYGVEHSRKYQDQMEEVYAVALEVTSQRHLFTPIPFARNTLQYSGGQKSSKYKSALTVTNEAGVTQKLPYGGDVTASGLVTFVDAISGRVDDGESALLALKGSMPLLRGFGMINLEEFIASERALVYKIREFEEFRRSFVVDTARSYFNLLAAQQGIRNRRINLATSIDLRERSQALYDANRLSALEVQRARQQELQAQSQLITAEESYQSSLDQFKLALGMPVEEPLDVAPVEMEVSMPKLIAEDAVAMALRYRLTLVTAADQVDDALRAVKNRQNGLLPDLTVNASGAVGNKKNTPAIELEGDTATYSAGLALELPIDRLKERNAYRAALIDYQKAQRDYSGEKDAVTAEVRSALRILRAAQISLEIQRVSIELAQRRVEFANIRLTQGAANSNRDVVEAQQSLLSAQDDYEKARSQLQISVLDYMRVTGTLRVDADSGTLGRVMDRAGLQANNSFKGR